MYKICIFVFIYLIFMGSWSFSQKGKNVLPPTFCPFWSKFFFGQKGQNVGGRTFLLLLGTYKNESS